MIEHALLGPLFDALEFDPKFSRNYGIIFRPKEGEKGREIRVVDEESEESRRIALNTVEESTFDPIQLFSVPVLERERERGRNASRFSREKRNR